MVAALLLGYAMLAQWLFHIAIVVPVAGPVVAAPMCLAITLGYRFAFIDREKRRLASIFKHYVNAKIVDLLMEAPEAAGVGGRRRLVTLPPRMAFWNMSSASPNWSLSRKHRPSLTASFM